MSNNQKINGNIEMIKKPQATDCEGKSSILRIGMLSTVILAISVMAMAKTSAAEVQNSVEQEKANDKQAKSKGISGVQVYYAGANDQIYAVASQNEVSRMHFEGEEIESLQFTQNEIEYAINGSDIYLKLKVEKPVNFFLKVKSGKVYQFLLVGEEVPSAQIFIKPKQNKKSIISRGTLGAKVKTLGSYSTAKKGVESDYEKSISRIIEVTVSETRHMGYNLREELGKIRLKRIDKNMEGISAKRVLVVKGKGLVARKIELKNESGIRKKINLANLASIEGSNQIACHLEKEELKPNEKAMFITVSKAEARKK
jgi:hypothetical protein